MDPDLHLSMRIRIQEGFLYADPCGSGSETLPESNNVTMSALKARDLLDFWMVGYRYPDNIKAGYPVWPETEYPTITSPIGNYFSQTIFFSQL